MRRPVSAAKTHPPTLSLRRPRSGLWQFFAGSLNSRQQEIAAPFGLAMTEKCGRVAMCSAVSVAKTNTPDGVIAKATQWPVAILCSPQDTPMQHPLRRAK